MKVGDLVRDTQNKDLGLVIQIECPDGEYAYKVLFSDGEEWLSDVFLEVISV